MKNKTKIYFLFLLFSIILTTNGNKSKTVNPINEKNGKFIL